MEISSALNMFNIAPHGPDISKMGSINKNKVLSMLKEPPCMKNAKDGKTRPLLRCPRTTHDESSHAPLRRCSTWWLSGKTSLWPLSKQRPEYDFPKSRFLCSPQKRKSVRKRIRRQRKEEKRRPKSGPEVICLGRWPSWR